MERALNTADMGQVSRRWRRGMGIEQKEAMVAEEATASSHRLAEQSASIHVAIPRIAQSYSTSATISLFPSDRWRVFQSATLPRAARFPFPLRRP